jgi:hypothetical protein
MLAVGHGSSLSYLKMSRLQCQSLEMKFSLSGRAIVTDFGREFRLSSLTSVPMSHSNCYDAGRTINVPDPPAGGVSQSLHD